MHRLRMRVDQIISELIPKYFVMAKVGYRYNQKNVWLQWHKTLSTAGEHHHTVTDTRRNWTWNQYLLVSIAQETTLLDPQKIS